MELELIMDFGLIFGLENYGEFGQTRYTATLSAGEKRRIPLLVPAGRRWLVFKYRFGDITAETINFRFDGVRNYFEQNILITTELLNFVVEPQPYLSVSGNSAAIVVWNTDAEERDFSVVLDYTVIDDEIAGKIRELIYAERDKFRAKVVKKAGTGGA